MSCSIAVIGTGYVGLTTGACLAHIGHRVTCVDIDEVKIERLRRGEIPILEAGLPELVTEGVVADRLHFTTDTAAAVTDVEFVFLCLPTPQGGDGAADLSYVRQAARTIGPHLKAHTVVVNKSTVPVGSAALVAQEIGRDDVFVVSNPEFLREGTAVHDFLHPDRVVVGSDVPDAATKLAAVYEPLNAPILTTDAASAEMIKYAANAFLATKISYINAIAAISEQVGADVFDVARGMGLDDRIGSKFLNPGPGWGGSCFPKDSNALVKIAADAGYDFTLLSAVVATNEAQFPRIAGKIENLLGGELNGKTVAVWGITYKANTDDQRDSPALRIIDELHKRGASVQAYDPTVEAPIDGIGFAGDPYTACEGADVLAILTEWDEFRTADFAKVAGLLSAPLVMDARNLVDRDALAAIGFTIDGIGR